MLGGGEKLKRKTPEPGYVTGTGGLLLTALKLRQRKKQTKD
jgi:hypothetical protein